MCEWWLVCPSGLRCSNSGEKLLQRLSYAAQSRGTSSLRSIFHEATRWSIANAFDTAFVPLEAREGLIDQEFLSHRSHLLFCSHYNCTDWDLYGTQTKNRYRCRSVSIAQPSDSSIFLVIGRLLPILWRCGSGVQLSRRIFIALGEWSGCARFLHQFICGWERGTWLESFETWALGTSCWIIPSWGRTLRNCEMLLSCRPSSCPIYDRQYHLCLWADFGSFRQ